MKEKRRWIMPAVAVILLAACLLVFRAFSARETAYLQSVCEKQLETYAQQNALGICGELESARKSVSLASEAFSDGVTLSQGDLHTLRTLLADTSFQRMFLSDDAGRSMSNNGSRDTVTGRAFYKSAMFGESTIQLAESGESGGSAVIVSAPVIEDGVVLGEVHGELELFPLFKIMNRNSFDGMGYAAMIDTDGSYLITSTNPNEMNTDGENLFDWLQRAKLSDGVTPESLREAMHRFETGRFSLTLGGQRREFFYMPVGINNWYLLQQVSGEYVEALFSSTRHYAFVLTVEICSCILAAVLVLFLYIRRGHRERDATAARFAALADNIPGGVFEIEIGDDFVVRYANDGFYALIGYTKEEYQGGDIGGHGLRIVCNSDEATLLAALRKQIEAGSTVSAELQICRSDHELRWVSLGGTVIDWEQGRAIVQAILTDITLQKEQTERIVENAKHDKMTQLYDKVSACDLIRTALNQKELQGVNAVLILDIDNFKHVNDTYGHSVGDRAIIMIADTLKKYFRNTDIIGRIGGDEFIVCMHDIPDAQFAAARIDTFQKRVRDLVLVDAPGALSCSVGCVVIPSGVTVSFEEAFQAADKGLYHIKKNTKGQAYVRPFGAEDAAAEGQQ